MANDAPPACLCPKGAAAIVPIAKPVFGERRLYRCTHCGTAQLFPLPVEEENLHELYQSDAYLGNIAPAEYKGYFTFFYKHLTETLGISKDIRLLDFGAGKCFYQKFFLEAGIREVHSLEINKHFVNFARNELGLDNVHLDASELAPESFDLVISNQVFEHLANPMAMLQDVILPLVKPGGRVVFAVPNWGSWNRPVLGTRWVGYSPEDHIWFFSPDSIRIQLAEIPGIEIENVTVGSSVGKPYNGFKPQGMVKKTYMKLFWEPFEAMGKGDQLIVSVRKAG